MKVIHKRHIPPALVINFDQTQFKLVTPGRSTLAQFNSRNVTVSSTSDERTITATFNVSLAGHLIPLQLIYGSKVT